MYLLKHAHSYYLKNKVFTFTLWNTNSSDFLTDRGLRTHKQTHICLKGFLWLDLRHGATTQAWNHLCRHTSINQHRRDVWHHETTRFTTQAKSSKCFHTELCVFYMSDYVACGLEIPVFYTCTCVQCKVVFRINVTVFSL